MLGTSGSSTLRHWCTVQRACPGTRIQCCSPREGLVHVNFNERAFDASWLPVSSALSSASSAEVPCTAASWSCRKVSTKRRQWSWSTVAASVFSARAGVRTRQSGYRLIARFPSASSFIIIFWKSAALYIIFYQNRPGKNPWLIVLT